MRGTISTPKKRIFTSASVCCPTKYAIMRYTKIPISEKPPLDTIAVLPDFIPRAVSRKAQYDMIGSIITT